MIRLAGALVVVAASASAYEAEGYTYDLTCNDNGFVLTSQVPVAREVGSGAEQRQSVGTETLYLGESCDAFHALYGSGVWCWANGGFVAEFTEHRFGFGRQELRCSAGERDAPETCRC